MFIRLLFCLFACVIAPAEAGLLGEHNEAPQYMQTREPAAIWSQVGDHVIPVGTIAAGQIIAVVPTVADYYEFNFGFGNGFIDKTQLEPVQGSQRVEDRLGDPESPSEQSESADHGRY